MLDLLKAIRSFKYAIKGIIALFKYENNAKIHLLATFIVIALGTYVKLSSLEWCVIIICIGLVTSAEAFNTAIEKLCDYLTTQHHPIIGKIKDLAAAGVLLVTIAAIFAGIIIFTPKIFTLF